jgi:predicted TIM-barrel fold metal-dependent hydrolase
MSSFDSATSLLTRRGFLQGSLGALSVAALERVEAAQNPADGLSLTDVNINLGQWPLRRVAGDDTGSLVRMLRQHGIVQAWAGSFEGLLHKDLGSVNSRLAQECRRHGHGVLLPFGTINPKSPDWEEDLRRCAKQHRMPGIRLHPNYHGYKLDDPAFERVLALASEHRLIVQLAVVMEDERMMHPLMRVEPVDTAPLAELVKKTGARLVLLNALRTLHGKPLLDLLAAGEVYVEISMLEGVGGLGQLLTQAPAHRLLFGSHAPLFYLDAALLKLKESPLLKEQRKAIGFLNAQKFLAAKL